MSVTTASLSDTLTPFMIDRAAVRGRMVRLGQVAQTILSRYDYPAPVAGALGELLLVAAMLSSNLKQEGIFTIQVRGNGPVKLAVVDAVYGGALRGFAEVDSAHELTGNLSPQEIFGAEAQLAITLDPGENKQRYQGVVTLEGDSLAEAFANYFTHSQQLKVAFHLAVGQVTLPATGAPQWMGGGLMIERLPQPDADDDEEGWRYASAVAATVKAGELLDPMLDAPALLYRLFHEGDVRVYDTQPLSVGCRCSRERILSLLRSMSPVDRAELVKDGKVSVHCQFCNKAERFTPQELGLSVN